MNKLTIEIDFDPAPSAGKTLAKVNGEAVGVIQALALNVEANSVMPALTVTLPYPGDEAGLDYNSSFKQMISDSEFRLRQLSPYIKIAYSTDYFKTSK